MAAKVHQNHFNAEKCLIAASILNVHFHFLYKRHTTDEILWTK